MKNENLPMRSKALLANAVKRLRSAWEKSKVFSRPLIRFFAKDSAPNLALVTTLIAVVAAAGLGVLHTVAEPRIAAAREAAFETAAEKVFPGFDGAGLIFTKSSLGDNIYAAFDSGGELIGFAVRISFRGLGGSVHMVAGVEKTLREVTGVEVVSHRETGDFSAFIERGAAEALASFEREVQP